MSGARVVAALERGLRCVTPDIDRTTFFALSVELGRALLAAPNVDLGQRARNALDVYSRLATCAKPNEEPEIWAQAQVNLGYCYMKCSGGDPAENLWRASVSLQLALNVFDAKHHRRQRATTLLNLGAALRRALRGRPSQNLEAAIRALEEALTLWKAPEEAFDWAQTASNLGNAYAERIAGERAENLDQALIAFQNALPVFWDQGRGPEWALSMSNLVATFIDRIRGERADNIERALGAADRVLNVLGPANPLATLAIFHRSRALMLRASGDRWDNIEAAITGFESVCTTIDSHRSPLLWAAASLGCADAYEARVLGVRAENLASAQRAADAALAVVPRAAYPLVWARATAARARLTFAADSDAATANVAPAFSAYQSALDVFVSAGIPAEILQTAREFGDALFACQRYQESTAPYRQALNAAEELYGSSLTRPGKVAELAASRGLAQRAAYALALSGEVRFACVVLERNRARWINDVLDGDRVDVELLRTANADIFAAYESAVSRVRALEAIEAADLLSGDNRTGTERQWQVDASDARRELQTARGQIAAVPGFGAVFGFVSFEDIAAAVPLRRPLVYLVSTSAGGLALIIRRSEAGEIGTQIVTLDRLTPAFLAELATGSEQATDRGWFGALTNAPSEGAAWFAAIDDVTQRLWEPLMEPLLAALAAGGEDRACIVPCGALAFFPLHAGWTKTPSGTVTFAIDRLVLTSTVSARALCRSDRIANLPVHRVLTIADPQPVHAPRLDNARCEAVAVASTFETAENQSGEAATRAAVLAALPNADVAHFACHGSSDVTNPLRSGIVLANDERLSVADVFALELEHTRLVTLSACETAMVGVALPDEAISLAEAFVRAGCAGVAGSLWSIPDRATAMLMARFYERLARPGEAGAFDPAGVLRDAQLWLRDTTNAEKRAYFGSFLPGQTHSPECVGRLSAQSAAVFFDALAGDDPAAYSYAHPFYWAAFAYTGT